MRRTLYINLLDYSINYIKIQAEYKGNQRWDVIIADTKDTYLGECFYYSKNNYGVQDCTIKLSELDYSILEEALKSMDSRVFVKDWNIGSK